MIKLTDCYLTQASHVVSHGVLSHDVQLDFVVKSSIEENFKKICEIGRMGPFNLIIEQPRMDNSRKRESIAKETKGRYQRKINYVDAVRYTGDNWPEIKKFVGFKPLGDVIPTHNFGPIQIWTQNGSVFARPGDWICRDAMGKYYPCSDDIFRATYYVKEEKE